MKLTSLASNTPQYTDMIILILTVAARIKENDDENDNDNDNEDNDDNDDNNDDNDVEDEFV